MRKICQFLPPAKEEYPRALLWVSSVELGSIIQVPALQTVLAGLVLRTELAFSQEVSVVISPRGGGLGAAGGGSQDLPLTRGLGHLRTQSVRSIDSPTGNPRPQALPDIGTPGTSVSNQVSVLIVSTPPAS